MGVSNFLGNEAHASALSGTLRRVETLGTVLHAENAIAPLGRGPLPPLSTTGFLPGRVLTFLLPPSPRQVWQELGEAGGLQPDPVRRGADGGRRHRDRGRRVPPLGPAHCLCRDLGPVPLAGAPPHGPARPQRRRAPAAPLPRRGRAHAVDRGEPPQAALHAPRQRAGLPDLVLSVHGGHAAAGVQRAGGGSGGVPMGGRVLGRARANRARIGAGRVVAGE